MGAQRPGRGAGHVEVAGPLDLAALAGALKISPESALFFLGKLVREGKATIGAVRATGA